MLFGPAVTGAPGPARRIVLIDQFDYGDSLNIRLRRRVAQLSDQ
jgi:hypothetical protein